MISYEAMVTEVTARLGGRTDIAFRIGRWINYALLELTLSPRFSFMELDDKVTFNTVVGQDTYVLDDSINLPPVMFWFVLDIRDNTNQIHIEKSHYQVLDRVARLNGRPYRYYRFKNTIVFDPIPDGVYEIQLRFRNRPPELASGTDYSGLLDEWEEPLVVLSTVKGWEALDQRDKAGEQRQLLEPMLAIRQDVPQLEDGVDSENTVEVCLDENRW